MGVWRGLFASKVPLTTRRRAKIFDGRLSITRATFRGRLLEVVHGLMSARQQTSTRAYRAVAKSKSEVVVSKEKNIHVVKPFKLPKGVVLPHIPDVRERLDRIRPNGGGYDSDD